jgi:hypothetical protein
MVGLRLTVFSVRLPRDAHDPRGGDEQAAADRIPQRCDAPTVSWFFSSPYRSLMASRHTPVVVPSQSRSATSRSSPVMPAEAGIPKGRKAARAEPAATLGIPSPPC